MDTGSYEYLKLCAARYVWPRRKELTPKAKEEREKEKPIWPRVVTWQRWWEKKFQDNFNAYAKAHGVTG